MGGFEEVLLITTSNNSLTWDVKPCTQDETNICCEDASSGGTRLDNCSSTNCCSAMPLCLAGLPSPRHCDAPKLGGLAGEGCSLELRCENGGTIDGIAFADWGQPESIGPDPLNASACQFRSAPNCSS